jgi:hypothetical protein
MMRLFSTLINYMDAPEEQGLDRLEEAWLRLAAVIRQREAELELLKKEFSILDRARALILNRDHGQARNTSLEGQSKRLGLRAEVLAAITNSEFGLSFSALVACIGERVDPSRYSSERSFNAAIQTTVRRLVAEGQVAFSSRNGKVIYTQSSKAGSAADYDDLDDKTERP